MTPEELRAAGYDENGQPTSDRCHFCKRPVAPEERGVCKQCSENRPTGGNFGGVRRSARARRWER